MLSPPPANFPGSPQEQLRIWAGLIESHTESLITVYLLLNATYRTPFFFFFFTERNLYWRYNWDILLNLTRDFHIKWRKRKTNTIWYQLYMESKIWHKWTYLQNRNRLMDIKNRLVVAKGEGGGSGMDGEFGVDRCTRWHLEWISNEILLYNTGNYIQSLGGRTRWMEDNMRKRIYIHTYICIYDWVFLPYSRNWYIINQL